MFQADQVLISLDNTNNSRGNIEGSKYESNIRNMELNKKDGVDQKSSLTTCQMKVSNKINQESQVFVMNLESSTLQVQLTPITVRANDTIIWTFMLVAHRGPTRR